jgi:hypothetical protein
MASSADDERQHEARKEKDIERILRAIAGLAQAVHRVGVDQRFTKVEPVDDVAHGGIVLRAQRRLVLRGVCVQAGAFARAHLLALQRHRLHALVQIAAVEIGHGERIEGRKHRDHHEGRQQDGRIGKSVGDGHDPGS